MSTKTFCHENHSWTIDDLWPYNIVISEKEDGCRYAIIGNKCLKFGRDTTYPVFGHERDLLLGAYKKYKLTGNALNAETTCSEPFIIKTIEYKDVFLVFENLENVYMLQTGMDVLYYRDNCGTWFMYHKSYNWAKFNQSQFLENTFQGAIARRITRSYPQEWKCCALPAKGFACESGSRNTYVRNVSGEWRMFLNISKSLNMVIQRTVKFQIEAIYICVQELLKTSRRVLNLTNESKYYDSTDVIKLLYKKRNPKEDIFISELGVSRELILPEHKSSLTLRLKSTGQLATNNEGKSNQKLDTEKVCLTFKLSADPQVSKEDKANNLSIEVISTRSSFKAVSSKKRSDHLATPDYKRKVSVCNVALANLHKLPLGYDDYNVKCKRSSENEDKNPAVNSKQHHDLEITNEYKETCLTEAKHQTSHLDQRKIPHTVKRDVGQNLSVVHNYLEELNTKNGKAASGFSTSPSPITKPKYVKDECFTSTVGNNLVSTTDHKKSNTSVHQVQEEQICDIEPVFDDHVSLPICSKHAVEEIKDNVIETESIPEINNLPNDFSKLSLTSGETSLKKIKPCSATEVEYKDQCKQWQHITSTEEQTLAPALLSILCSTLQTGYYEQFEWLNVQSVQWITEKSSLSFINRRGNVLKGIDVLCTSNYKSMLLLGEAGFGKSALCTLIAKMWTENKLPDFELCILISCSEIKCFSSFYDVLLNEIEQLNEKIFSLYRKLIEKILESKAEKILILFDGIDEMTTKNRSKFLSLFSQPSFLNISTIIVTSRPSAIEFNVEQLFEQCLHMRGFDYETSVLSHPTLQFDTYWMTSKAFYMTGFPPKFLYYFQKGFITSSSYKESFFDLLYDITLEIAKDLVYELARIEMLFRKLGKFCYKLLLLNRSSFSVKFLQSIVGTFQQSILKLGIFTTCRPSNEIGDELKCHKVLAVFFATLFLCHKWDRATKKSDVIERYLCPDGTVPDVVVDYSQTGDTSKYVVGIFPEIVFNVVSNHAQQFIMYYDMECKNEMSSAFDSINLLLRVSPKHLARFAFEKRTDDLDMQASFSDVINIFEFDGTVDMKFFSNSYEENNYLVWTVEDSESSTSVLQGVVVKRQGKESRQSLFWYDKMHLTFKLSKVAEFANAMRNLLCIKKSDDDFEKNFSAVNLVSWLLKALMKRNANHVASFSFFESVDDYEGFIARSDAFSFDVTVNGASLIAGAPFMDATSHVQDLEGIFCEINNIVVKFKCPLMSVYLK